MIELLVALLAVTPSGGSPASVEPCAIIKAVLEADGTVPIGESTATIPNLARHLGGGFKADARPVVKLAWRTRNGRRLDLIRGVAECSSVAVSLQWARVGTRVPNFVVSIDVNWSNPVSRDQIDFAVRVVIGKPPPRGWTAADRPEVYRGTLRRGGHEWRGTILTVNT
jgi:hypothetical protein